MYQASTPCLDTWTISASSRQSKFHFLQGIVQTCLQAVQRDPTSVPVPTSSPGKGSLVHKARVHCHRSKCTRAVLLYEEWYDMPFGQCGQDNRDPYVGGGGWFFGWVFSRQPL